MRNLRDGVFIDLTKGPLAGFSMTWLKYCYLFDLISPADKGLVTQYQNPGYISML